MACPYLRKIKSHGKPVVAIITGGCPMNLAEVHEIADAVLLAWYPGEEGGNAIADILFGKISPSSPAQRPECRLGLSPCCEEC